MRLNSIKAKFCKPEFSKIFTALCYLEERPDNSDVERSEFEEVAVGRVTGKGVVKYTLACSPEPRSFSSLKAWSGWEEGEREERLRVDFKFVDIGEELFQFKF